MALTKPKIHYSCLHCGHSQSKWVGQCPTCFEWNSLKEEAILPLKFKATPSFLVPSKPISLPNVGAQPVQRIISGLGEVDRLLGGGVVPGSLTLVGGDPGVGKSTLLLQLASAFATKGLKVLYVSGEESCQQTSMRAERLKITSPNIYLFSETLVESIENEVEILKPDLLIIDSIQIVYKGEIPSSAGSVTQVRESTTAFMRLAKGRSIPTFLIGHVTKGGEIAGPKVLEHLVDTVLYFEGEPQGTNRFLRVVKNRFGPTDEVGVFQMVHDGLKEVLNPSELFLGERLIGTIGSLVVPTIEGSRPLLVEAQALVTKSGFVNPTRRSTGLDPNRLALLLAVLEKRVGFQLHTADVFVSLAGGLKIFEPAVDLGILLAIASSWKNRPVDPELVVVGEVGLGGEVRSVPKIASRLKEAELLGFKRALIPEKGLKQLPQGLKMEIIKVRWVDEAIGTLFR